MCERELESEQNCNILAPNSYGYQRFFPVFLGCSTGGLESSLSGCWFSLPHLISNWLNFLCPELYNILRPPSSCGRHKLHSFNSSTVKVILCYFPTGCTCYLHRRISYFDRSAGSEVNVQHQTKPNQADDSTEYCIKMHVADIWCSHFNHDAH